VAAESKGGLPVRRFATVTAFERWLEGHVDSGGLWLKIAKAGSGNTSISYQEALEAAICFGWIDGHKVGYDDGWWLQRFTPRRPRGRWSQINCAKALTLTAAGRMRPQGLAEVEAARSDGRWAAAYAGQRTARVPDDLQAALDQSPTAGAFFTTLNSTNRYAVLYRIDSVKRADTRARKIAQVVTMLEAGETFHPQAQKGP
jgi:uncharacterized protein YdeI (YjbR/CyaY-like superfamily)